MKTLTEKIAALRTDTSNAVIDEQTYQGGYNNAIYDVINILQSYPTIKAKALRKKGTDEWYQIIANEYLEEVFVESGLPYPYLPNTTLENLKEWGYNLPIDIELVELTIIVEPNQEGE